MTSEPGYPVTLIHPQHKAAVPIQGGAPAQLERFPQVVVHGAAHEAEHRAMGYLRFGEAQKQTDYNEYPKILRHAEHRDARAAYMDAKIEDGKMMTFQVVAVAEHMPDVIVKNLEEEEKWREKDYKPAGEYDKEALSAALSGVDHEAIYNPQEYPKYVEDLDKPVDANGVRPMKLLHRDPDAEEEYIPSPAYPRWEDGQLIQDPKLPPPIDPNKYPMWVHKDGIPSDESELANTPEQEFKIRQKWAPPKIVEEPPEFELPDFKPSRKHTPKVDLNV